MEHADPHDPAARRELAARVGTVLTNLMNTSDTVTVTAGGTTGKQITVSLKK
jgi:DNA-binding transcriptional regulator LsrR (DeoR family)